MADFEKAKRHAMLCKPSIAGKFIDGCSFHLVKAIQNGLKRPDTWLLSLNDTQLKMLKNGQNSNKLLCLLTTHAFLMSIFIGEACAMNWSKFMKIWINAWEKTAFIRNPKENKRVEHICIEVATNVLKCHIYFFLRI